MTNEVYHIPALLPESISNLITNPSGVYVDCTFGGGGHSKAILENLNAEGRLFAFDKDNEALENKLDDSRFALINEDFRYMERYLRLEGISKVDGILADLGVSFHQFDAAYRGFSFRFPEADLDMRMSPSQTKKASDILNELDTQYVVSILKKYGEINNAKAVAAAIDFFKSTSTFTTVGDLLKAIQHLVPISKRNKFLAQVFQALRIEVNEELVALEEMLLSTLKVLNPNGRLVVLSYHSLEDRIVKNFIKSGNLEGEITKDFYGNIIRPIEPLFSGALVPSDLEVAQNPRSRSAKLRVGVKL